MMENTNSDVLPIRPIYYLNHWYRYKEEVQNLEGLSKRNAIRLFKGLKELDEEDRMFLAMKFDRKHKLIDEEVAEQAGMKVKEFKKHKQDLIKLLGTKITAYINEIE